MLRLSLPVPFCRAGPPTLPARESTFACGHALLINRLAGPGKVLAAVGTAFPLVLRMPRDLRDFHPVSGASEPWVGPPVTSRQPHSVAAATCKTETAMGRSGGWDFQQIGKDLLVFSCRIILLSGEKEEKKAHLCPLASASPHKLLASFPLQLENVPCESRCFHTFTQRADSGVPGRSPCQVPRVPGV